MKLHLFILPALLALAATLFVPAAQADDKKKILEWQLQQQQLQQQWKLQEVQRQQALLRQQQQNQNQRNRGVVIAGAPWGTNQNGRGSMAFTGAPAERLNAAVVTLNNFYDPRGNVNNSGTATVTLYGTYSYPFKGTWAQQGNLTVALSLTPAANVARGDRATGNLTMSPPNGQTLSGITLTGTMSGNPFTATFRSQ